MSKVKHWYGTLASYNAIASKDAGTLYNVWDSQAIYKGTSLLCRTGVTMDTAQTITGAKNFTGGMTVNSYGVWHAGNLTNALTASYLPYWSGSGLVNSAIYTDGTKVGIGTTTPSTKLHISGEAYPRATIETNSATSGDVYFDFIGARSTNDDALGYIKASNKVSGSSVEVAKLMFRRDNDNGAGAISFYTATGGVDTEKMRITNLGNVGISTTIPIGKFQIGNPTGATGNSYSTIANIFGTETAGRGQLNVFSTAANAVDAGSSLVFGGETGNTVSTYPFAKIKGAKEIAGASYNGYLSFFTTATNSALVERMRITSDGKVGIGTTNPSAPLTVVAQNSDNYALNLLGSTGNAATLNFYSHDGATRYGYFYADANSTQFRSISGVLSFGTIGVERMRIDSVGNVGIGTTAPTFGKLQVVGAFTGAGTAPLVVWNTNAYADPYTQYSQVWLNSAGGVMGWVRNDGNFYLSGRMQPSSIQLSTTGNYTQPVIFQNYTTGISFPATNEIAFVNNLTNSMVIKSDGNVGIGYSTGTEISTYKLAVNGTGYFLGNLTAPNVVYGSGAYGASLTPSAFTPSDPSFNRAGFFNTSGAAWTANANNWGGIVVPYAGNTTASNRSAEMLFYETTGVMNIWVRNVMANVPYEYQKLWHDRNSNLNTVDWTSNTLRSNIALIGYSADPTSGNKLAVNGPAYFNGAITATSIDLSGYLSTEGLSINGASTIYGQLEIDLLTDITTPPFIIYSTGMVQNLNAQLLGGYQASAFALSAHTHAESSLSFSDILTNNATSLMHGYLPKLSGTATQFLNGAGAWATPVSTGSRLLYSSIMSGSITSTYAFAVFGTGAAVNGYTIQMNTLTSNSVVRVKVHGEMFLNVSGSIIMTLSIGGLSIPFGIEVSSDNTYQDIEVDIALGSISSNVAPAKMVGKLYGANMDGLNTVYTSEASGNITTNVDNLISLSGGFGDNGGTYTRGLLTIELLRA